MKAKTNDKCALFITTTNLIIRVEPLNKKDFTLHELQTFVGGRIDIINISYDNLIMVVNDDGLYTDSYNQTASLFLKEQFNKECNIYGDVLLCPSYMVK